ncbi:dehydrogenase E1 component subunit alpha/beta [Marinoscillum sp. MHG1-6]|uniref:alpha-ketoacid dehydrogenase subunit alpha/beta n=1 Tax=Marinoscillum sp. MHG1-6 TaxID=2959627 RepID=UPI0021587834|nr:dehydrogenase E1 component subunit alpha/beta [Marinoscillum sp. MHG1-6]
MGPIVFDRKNRDNDQLISIYKELILPRLIEEKMLILLRQGKISKWFSGIGQEAISIGVALALHSDEYILPMHRNLGIFTSRGIPLTRLFEQFQGKAGGFTKGRDRSFHFGSRDFHLIGMISHLGAQMPVADGIALASLLKKEHKITAVFTGDGGASEGDFHEALNVASVWNLPVIFIIENNGYGLSTPSMEQFNFESFVVKGPAYGIEAVSIDGNNVLEVLSEMERLASDLRTDPRPVILEVCTFRMRGHEEASGTDYVPKELMESWAEKDPVDNYERYLLAEGVVNQSEIDSIKAEIKGMVSQAVNEAFSKEPVEADPEEELSDVYFPFEQEVIEPASDKTTNRRFIDAISDGLRQGMEKYPELVLMGQDIAEYGGVFKVTDGFLDQFGKERVRNTPISESVILGAGLGLSIKDMKSMIEMQFADFVSCGFNQIVNNLAKSHYRWGQNADVVIRMPTGGGMGAGPFHSQSNEAWFFHTPGLKIVYPSNPYDAKGLLLASLEDPNPYLFFEHKYLYRSLSDEIPDDYYTVEVGKAQLVREGTDLSIITYGMGVHWAKEIMDELGVEADLLDLRTLLPWDKAAVEKTVNKTNKVLILHEDTLTGGIGAEISAWISEHCFEQLDGPVMREASLDSPIPFAQALENNFLPKNRIKDKINQLLRY